MKKFNAFLKKYPELLSIPIAIAIWIISGYILRLFDPTAAVFDAGIFQIPLFAILQLFVYVSVSWLLMRMVFGTVTKHLKTDFKENFNNLSPWQKILISYAVFFCLLFALILLSHTLIASR